MSENTTVEIAFKALQNFMQKKPFLLFGSGTYCSVDSRFRMIALGDYLVKEIPGQGLTSVEVSVAI